MEQIKQREKLLSDLLAVGSKIDPEKKYLDTVLKAEESRVQVVGELLKQTMKLNVPDTQLQQMYTASVGKIKTELMGEELTEEGVVDEV